LQQGANGRGCAGARAQFEDLAEKDESRDGRGGFEIDGDLAGHGFKRGREDAGEEDSDEAVDVGGAGAECDQSEHVEAAIDERGPAAFEEREAAPEDDGSGEGEFDPTDGTQGEEMLDPLAWDEIGHGEDEDGDRESEADPEAARH